jgi:hypothetical protein
LDHTRCRRRDVDFDTDGRECWRHGANEHRCRQGGQNEPDALRGNLPIDSETIFKRIHFETASIEKPGMGPVNAYEQVALTISPLVGHDHNGAQRNAAANKAPANTSRRSPRWFQPSKWLILKLSDPKDRAANVVKAYFITTTFRPAPSIRRQVIQPARILRTVARGTSAT